MGDLFKNRLSKDGIIVSTEKVKDKETFRSNIMERVKKEMDENQGCQLQGTFKVYRVPGNFHIASHAFGDIKMILQRQGYSFDYSYTINHLSFGNKKDFNYISRKFTDLEMIHPVDGVEGEAEMRTNNEGKEVAKATKSMFYLVAVPSYFESGLFRYHVY
mmetsp:Transcript_31912/g.48898  ORF Transcript_31912/g.48898 Transcript_31912/m.48898 type:complete len:160 (-) Transcript_31912:205-684(-)|eukprot:CAMPEP_0170488622 /NCGR_PEP_ID=MMETSP0208-20121228/7134_1 /TAXON_ID=197538 /ORGANISM="Strombidium inclinatum, Strain S3" /LENGTH=159 /DNA_ID=CAMNT_0010763253 /DNA_START=251 /DNA_END=730 /DNA_ORIENTATION=-